MSRISCIPLFVCAVLYMKSTTAQKDLGFALCGFNNSTCNANIAKMLLNKPVTPVDPLHIKSLKLPPNPNSAINVGLSFTNVGIRGLSNAQNIKVDGFTRDVSAPITLGCTVPKASFSGAYEGDADISLTCEINAKLVQKNDKNYLDINNVSLVLSKPKNVHYQLDGLYDGNAELTATLNNFLNGNWYEVFEGMRPGIQETFEFVVLEYIKNVFSLLPYDDLFSHE